MLTRDEPLARALTRLRAELNELFEARAAAPSLKGARPIDRAELLAQLGDVGRALLAAAGRGDGRDDELVRALFRQLLVVQRDATAYRDAVFGAWRTVAAAVPGLLAESPLAVLGSVANAVMTLSRGHAALVAPWVSRLAELAPQCRSVESLRDLGTLLAWRLGFVAVRGAAVRALPALPPELAAPVFGLGGEVHRWPAVAKRLAQDRWYDPRDPVEAPRLALVASVGGFAGLGGMFLEPPKIARLGENLIAFDRERAALLIADRFGQACVSMTRSDALGVGGDARAYVKKDGTVTFGSLRFQDPRLTEALSAAATEDVLAVSVAHSLKVHLIARIGSGA